MRILSVGPRRGIRRARPREVPARGVVRSIGLRNLGAFIGIAVLAVSVLACSPQIPLEHDGEQDSEHSDQDIGHGSSVPHLRAEVIRVLPHDRSSFTQGWELVDGTLYEGTGTYGGSKLRALDPETGEVRRQARLPPTLFGEGITVVGDRIWQLTWQEGVAILRDRNDLSEISRARYSGEGWGLCYDDAEGDDEARGRDRARLVMSDGSSRLTFRDPRTFARTGEVTVTIDGSPVDKLNELECVGGPGGPHVLANVWGSDDIVRIDPRSGEVTTVIDASGLLSPEEQQQADVLNGIASVPGADEFLLTGKYWPHAYRVRFR